MYKYVFIDLDDTIWDFHTNARLTLHQMYDEGDMNKHFESFEEFFRIYAKKNIELWEAYGKGEITREFLMAERFRYTLSRMGVDDHQLAEAIGHQYLEILPTKTALMPDAIEVLDYLKQKYPLTLISNGFTEVQYKKINSSGIRHYFNHIILSEEARALKPDPKIFEYALQLNGAQPHEAIMIGDSYEADIRGAINAGIDQVFFPLNKQYDKNQPATYKISRLIELKEFL
jgi:YjjG family noncanonical pyrimidine nucleotidase